MLVSPAVSSHSGLIHPSAFPPQLPESDHPPAGSGRQPVLHLSLERSGRYRPAALNARLSSCSQNFFLTFYTSHKCRRFPTSLLNAVFVKTHQRLWYNIIYSCAGENLKVLSRRASSPTVYLQHTIVKKSLLTKKVLRPSASPHWSVRNSSSKRGVFAQCKHGCRPITSEQHQNFIDLSSRTNKANRKECERTKDSRELITVQSCCF